MRLGKPEEREDYDRLEIDGVCVFYQRSLADLFGTITVRVEKLLFIKSLAASGER